LQDLLCNVATGGSVANRKLYSDGEEFTAEVKRPLILNGINVVATRPDLVSRVLPIRLVKPPAYRREEELNEAFEADHAEILGRLLDLFVRVLNRVHNADNAASSTRLKDFSTLGDAVAEEFGLEPGYFARLLKEREAQAIDESLKESPAAMAIVAMMERRGTDWPDENAPADQRTMKALFEAVAKHKPLDSTRLWPATARRLRGVLDRNADGLEARGIRVEYGSRAHGGIRQVHLVWNPPVAKH
jgi:hypothetical protein